MNNVNKEPSLVIQKKALLSKITIRYFWIFSLLFVAEIAIAIFHFHKFIRGFVGDILVIPVLYCFGKMFFKLSSKKVLYGILVFAFLVEVLQLFSFAEVLNIQNNILNVVMGSHFDLLDLVAYLLGIIPVILIEKFTN